MLCRRRHSADDTDFTHVKHRPRHDNAELANQQQRMIDLLQLRSDELSAENGKLRLEVAAAGSNRQPSQSEKSQQLQHDYVLSHAAIPTMQSPQHIHVSQAGPTTDPTPGVSAVSQLDG